MSMWTHVAGVFRYDILPISSDYMQIEEQWLREIVLKNVPCGSEDGLNVVFLKSAATYEINALNAVVLGDLRGFSSAEFSELIKWFESCVLLGKKHIVRQAVLKAEDECGDNMLLTLDCIMGPEYSPVINKVFYDTQKTPLCFNEQKHG